ncbi:transposase [Emticicia sp. TH156]|uniref:transposase n=1 Tax=Emticicia sp. TH156 TaxID=2067454 RepID=UPI001C1FEF8E|nr:transposase [Emticicia sp. TH156]
MNELGKVAHKCWMGIPGHFPDVFLHEFIIMPNHMHGIIELRPDYIKPSDNVGVQNFEPLLPKINQYQKIIPRSIGSIVRGFKIGVTKWYRETTLSQNQIWQRNYHEHIIRNEESYNTISHYIHNNPKNWKADKFYI